MTDGKEEEADEEDEEEEEGVLGVVSLLTERERGLELLSCDATLTAMGCSCRGLGAPPVVCC